MHMDTRCTAIKVLQKKTSKAKYKHVAVWKIVGMLLDSEKVEPTLGVVEGIYDAYFNQIHARNIIKHSETQIT